MHAEALPHGFFASLGQPYLRVYYRGFVESPHACGFVAEADGGRVGMVVGITDCNAHRRFLLRHHSMRLAVRGAVALARRPRLGAHFLSTRMVRYATVILRATRPAPVLGDSPATSPTPARVGVLSHVAVVPEARGSGVGERLVQGFVAEAGRRGVARIELVTLSGARGAAPFYERLGWQQGPVVAHDGDQFVKFTLDLP